MSEEIQRSLGRIEGKLDNIIDRQEKHEKRLDGLDEIKNKGYGILTAVAIAAGAIGSYAKAAISSLLTH